MIVISLMFSKGWFIIEMFTTIVVSLYFDAFFECLPLFLFRHMLVFQTMILSTTERKLKVKIFSYLPHKMLRISSSTLKRSIKFEHLNIKYMSCQK